MGRLALWALLVLAVASCRGCDPPQQSAVDVPTTLASAKAMSAPPAVVVTVERKKREVSAGGGCGHSPLCVLLLPVLLLAPLFPDKWDEVRIVREGSPYYEGRFTTEGRFLDAVVRQDGVARSIGVLMLDKLGRHVVVEIARAPLGSSGEPGEYVRSPILPQVDLTKEYAAKLATLRAPDDRSALLLEYAHWLAAESNAWLASIAPDEHADSAGALLADLCPADAPDKAGTCEAVLDALADKPKPILAALALSRSAPRAELADAATAHRSVDRSLRLGRYLAGVGCNDDVLTAMDGLRFLRPVMRGRASVGDAGPSALDAVTVQVVADARACPTPRRVHMLASLGQTVDERDALAALTPAGPESEALARALAHDAPAHRRALVGAALARVASGGDEGNLVEALAWSTTPPDADELALLAKSFPRSAGARPWRRRACIVARVDAAARAKVPLEAVDGAMRTSMAAAPDAERAVYAAARIHLGELEQASLAATAFGGAEFVPHACWDVTDESSLVGYSFFLAGCTPGEALALQRKAKRAQPDGGAPPPPHTVTPDRLCTKPIDERPRD